MRNRLFIAGRCAATQSGAFPLGAGTDKTPGNPTKEEVGVKKISENEETRNLDAEALIEGNLRLVLKIANDFLGRGLPWDDLVSEGNRGLMTAARRYNPRRGAKFSTYSALWIKQAIRQAIAEQAQAVRIPIGTQQNSRRIQRCVRELENTLGRDPSDEEVAQKTGLPLVTVQRLRDKRQADMQSLNAIISNADQDGTEFQDFFADEITPPPDQALLKIEDIEQLLSLLDTLTDRERQVLRLRFGLDGSPILTLEEVGKKLDCTNERVRQIQNQALQKLHDRMIDDERRHR